MTSLGVSEPQQGDLIGEYLLGNELGRGGMGIVFLCTPVRSQRPTIERMVLKWFRPGRVCPQAVREIGRRLAQFQNPAVVRTIDVDSAGTYLVMEEIQGEALGPYLKRCGRLASREFQKLTTNLCDGLESLHSFGLLHRDVRPINIIRCRRGWVLIDLSIPYDLACISSKSGNLTERGASSYIAPEVLAGRQHVIQSDIYSCSVTLFHALIGRRPDRDALGNHLGRKGYDDRLSLQLREVFQIGASATPEGRFSTIGALKSSIIESVAGVT